MDGERLGIDAVQAALGRFDGQALGHAFKQVMAPVRRQNDGLTTFGDQRSGFALEREMADHVALAAPRNHRDKLTALNPGPVAVG